MLDVTIQEYRAVTIQEYRAMTIQEYRAMTIQEYRAMTMVFFSCSDWFCDTWSIFRFNTVSGPRFNCLDFV